MYASLVLYPILIRKDTAKYRIIAVENFVNSMIYSNKDFAAVTRILSVPLENQRAWHEPDLKSCLQSYYAIIFNMLEKTLIFNEAKLVETR